MRIVFTGITHLSDLKPTSYPGEPTMQTRTALLGVIRACLTAPPCQSCSSRLEARLRFRDPRYDNERALIAGEGDGYVFGACDPSVGRRKNKGDYSAVIVLYHSEEMEIKHVTRYEPLFSCPL